jgi:hypothetical protein
MSAFEFRPAATKGTTVDFALLSVPVFAGAVSGFFSVSLVEKISLSAKKTRAPSINGGAIFAIAGIVCFAFIFLLSWM